MILNHTVEALMERRSIRSYRSEQISEEELTDVLKAGKYAPAASLWVIPRNTQNPLYRAVRTTSPMCVESIFDEKAASAFSTFLQRSRCRFFAFNKTYVNLPKLFQHIESHPPQRI